MVGVPRSHGCRTCLQRRIKCDESIPECSRCRDRGVSCPGYSRALKFCPETPHIPKPRPRLNKAPANQSTTIASAPILRRIRPHGLPIDELLAPALTHRALTTQHGEIFCSWIATNYSCLYASYEAHVALDPMIYMRHELDTAPAVVQGAVCALTTLHLATVHADRHQRLLSWERYGTASAQLRTALAPRPTGVGIVVTDEMLFAAILLGLYAISDGAGSTAWLAHARGISDMFRIRGPGVLTSRIGRPLFVAYRSCVLVEAFWSRRACPFDTIDWKHMIVKTALVMEEPAVRVWELASCEIFACPGYLARAEEVLRSQVLPIKLALMDEMRRSKANLTKLGSQLTGTFPTEESSWSVRGEFVQSNLDNIASATRLLTGLLQMLEHKEGGPEDPWALLDPAKMISSDTHGGLDSVAMSMGLNGLTI